MGYDGVVTLHTLSDDLSTITASEPILTHPGAEGTKIVKRNGWYYMFHSIPSRLGMTISRARSIRGPWEIRDSVDDTTGGHQGAIVDLPDGRDYGFIMVDSTGIGRLTNISPIVWQEGWPIWGTSDAPGRVPETAEIPIPGYETTYPATSDDFSAPTLGLQWQWNHNPLDEKWSLTERPGHLRLYGTQADRFWLARNTLTQKTWAPVTDAIAKLDVRNLKPGDQCGLGTLGKYSALLSVNGGSEGRHTLSMRIITDQGQDGPQDVDPRASDINAYADWIYLRARLDFERDQGELSYSFDAEDWTLIGGSFPMAFDWRTGTFQGEQLALFCFNSQPDGGYIDIDQIVLSGGD